MGCGNFYTKTAEDYKLIKKCCILINVPEFSDDLLFIKCLILIVDKFYPRRSFDLENFHYIKFSISNLGFANLSLS